LARTRGKNGVIEMAEDADLTKADLALSELPRAKALPRDQSLHIIRHLASTTQNNGLRDRTIETAQADAWLAISAIGQTLDGATIAPTTNGRRLST
jgi:hypothetical protein